MAEESAGAEGGDGAEETPERRSGADAARTEMRRIIEGARFGRPIQFPGGKPARVKARVPLRTGSRYVVLPLDTELDRLVASCTNAFSCLTDLWRETEYYAHTDPSGNSRFYKTGSKVPWEITPAMEEWMAAFPGGAGCEAELGTVCHEMLASPRARAVAERLCGIKFMSRRALLRDLTYLKEHDHIEILDDGLREEHGSRPTSRGIGGYPPRGLMEYSEIEEELYWKRLYAGKPILPEVLQFVEENRRHSWYAGWRHLDEEPDGADRGG